ncbi:MAG: hypothetical protein MJE77_26210 [Proteobacteria bacterium]|nr:hypothetical protein [Pseudomonadota bacterium]
MKPGPITVDIDQLVLRGFDRASAAELAGEIRQALTRKLAEHGPPAVWTAADRQYIAGLDIPIRATDSPGAIAESLAARLCADTDDSRGGQP